MTPFTRLKEPYLAALAQEKIENDLDLIQKAVLTLLGDHLHSLLLCGSFGRGEGAVVVENGQVRIVNDYDFTVVLDTANPITYARLYRRFHAPLERLGEELARQLAIKQVDLSPKPLTYFSGFPGRPPALKIENYEVKKGHVLVFAKKPGDDPALSMPDWQAKEIPLFEGTWLFRNRGTGLILAALYFDREGRVLPRNVENFIIECNKALLAAGDSLLLLRKRYHHLYEERLRAVRELDVTDLPFGAELVGSYARALEFKLRPDFKSMADLDLLAFWTRTCTLFESMWQYFESLRLETCVETWTAYADLDRPDKKASPKAFAAALIRGRSLSPRQILRYLTRSAPGFTISLVPLILFSRSPSPASAAMMARAAAMLDLPLTRDRERDWDQLARTLIRLVHPGGEAGRVLAESGGGDIRKFLTRESEKFQF